MLLANMPDQIVAKPLIKIPMDKLRIIFKEVINVTKSSGMSGRFCLPCQQLANEFSQPIRLQKVRNRMSDILMCSTPLSDDSLSIAQPWTMDSMLRSLGRERSMASKFGTIERRLGRHCSSQNSGKVRIGESGSWVAHAASVEVSQFANAANSGQISCQSAGRISCLVTAPSSSFSIFTHRAGDIGASPEASCDKYDGEIPSALARRAAPPRSSDSR